MSDLLKIFLHIWNVIVESNTFNFIFFAWIFVWIFKKINVKGIVEGLHQKILSAIETAKNTKASALIQLQDAELSVKNLDNELNTIIQDATKSAEIIAEKIIEDAKHQVNHIETNALKVIEAEEKMLISLLTKNASKASVEVAKVNLIKALDKNSKLHEKYINESIDELDRLNF